MIEWNRTVFRNGRGAEQPASGGGPLDKWRLLGEIINDKKLSRSRITTAWWILEHYNFKSGRCDPSYDTLADETGLSRSTVIESVNQLVQRGWITRHLMGGRHRSNSYTPAFERVRESGPLRGRKQSETTGENGPESPGKTVRAAGPKTVNETVNQTIGDEENQNQEWEEQAWWLCKQGHYEKRHGFGAIELARDDLRECRKLAGDEKTLRWIEEARKKGLYSRVLEEFFQRRANLRE